MGWKEVIEQKIAREDGYCHECGEDLPEGLHWCPDCAGTVPDWAEREMGSQKDGINWARRVVTVELVAFPLCGVALCWFLHALGQVTWFWTSVLCLSFFVTLSTTHAVLGGSLMLAFSRPHVYECPYCLLGFPEDEPWPGECVRCGAYLRMNPHRFLRFLPRDEARRFWDMRLEYWAVRGKRDVNY